MASLPFFLSSLSSFPQISLSVLQHRLCKSPEPVCTVCRINLLIRLNNNLTESTVFWGVRKLNCLTERSDDTQRTSAKQGGETCQKKGRGRTVPFNSSEWLKCPRYIPVISESAVTLSDYSQHSSRICFQHANPCTVRARQGVLKPFYWSTPALWHFLCSGVCTFVNDKLWIYRHSRGVFLSTLYSLLQWEYKLYFLEKGLQQ